MPCIKSALRSQVDHGVAGFDVLRSQIRRVPRIQIDVGEDEFAAVLECFGEDCGIQLGFFFENVRETRVRRRATGYDRAIFTDLGGKIVAIAFLIELAFLNGRAKLPGHDILSLLTDDAE